MTKALHGKHFDVVILGAGMSGLAAGIRLGMYDKKVLLLERHYATGGLNSFYRLGGYDFDVGLHALTNYVKEGTKGTPLGKIFRQLRIPRASFDLCPQTSSAIHFPGIHLKFSNDFELIRSEVASHFPREIDRFDVFVDFVRNYHAVNLDPDSSSARQRIAEFIQDPLLIEMLLCPLLYYGSARENDMDFGQFVVLFQAIFLEGFARPFKGVRPIINTLLKRLRTVGAERRMGLGVRKLHVKNSSVSQIELDDGSIITAKHVLSSIGALETETICSDTLRKPDDEEGVGRLSFAECIAILDREPSELGLTDTVTFFNNSNKLSYERPSTLLDPRSGVICIPNHYDYGERKLSHGILRVTTQASYPLWKKLDAFAYTEAKTEAFHTLIHAAATMMPGSSEADIKRSIRFHDVFTPTTITRFTGHFSGAVYGAPVKVKDGQTRISNLYLCGTDQGFLGIVGAMLSGISIANYHILKKD